MTKLKLRGLKWQKLKFRGPVFHFSHFLNIYTNKFSFFSGLENVIICFSFKILIIMGPIKTSIGPFREQWSKSNSPIWISKNDTVEQ